MTGAGLFCMRQPLQGTNGVSHFDHFNNLEINFTIFDLFLLIISLGRYPVCV